jgi:hypothetical protein
MIFKYLMLTISMLLLSGSLVAAPRVRITPNVSLKKRRPLRAALSEEERDGLLLVSALDIFGSIAKLGIDNPNNPMSEAEKADVHGIINSLQKFVQVLVRRHPAIARRLMQELSHLTFIEVE